eukprot:324939-Chlamydomonas_euryale.AAC.2
MLTPSPSVPTPAIHTRSAHLPASPPRPLAAAANDGLADAVQFGVHPPPFHTASLPLPASPPRPLAVAA